MSMSTSPSSTPTRYIVNTIKALSNSSSAPLEQLQDASKCPFGVIARSVGSADNLPDPLTIYLQSLTQSANSTAESLAYGSVLAGKSSESDEFGDVAVCLVPPDVAGKRDASAFGPGRERDALESLGLAHLVGPGRGPEPVTLGPTERGGTPETRELADLLAMLHDRHAFSVRGDHALVFYFLLGRHRDFDDVWVGLAGVGAQSD